jgi:hypothetical protein
MIANSSDPDQRFNVILDTPVEANYIKINVASYTKAINFRTGLLIDDGKLFKCSAPDTKLDDGNGIHGGYASSNGWVGQNDRMSTILTGCADIEMLPASIFKGEDCTGY